jgi:hypothetical protein
LSRTNERTARFFFFFYKSTKGDVPPEPKPLEEVPNNPPPEEPVPVPPKGDEVDPKPGWKRKKENRIRKTVLSCVVVSPIFRTRGKIGGVFYVEVIVSMAEEFRLGIWIFSILLPHLPSSGMSNRKENKASKSIIPSI